MRQKQAFCSHQTREKEPWYSRRPWLRGKKRDREGGGRIQIGQRSMRRYRVPERRSQCLGRVSVNFEFGDLKGTKLTSFLLVLIQLYCSSGLRSVSRKRIIRDVPHLYFETIVRDLLFSTDEFEVMPHGGYEAFSDVVSAKGVSRRVNCDGHVARPRKL